MRRIVGFAATAIALMAGTPATAAVVSTYEYAFQGVDFTFNQLDADTFTLQMEGARSAGSNWDTATHLQAIGFKNLGIDFKTPGYGATLTASPAGTPASDWSYVQAELDADGCKEARNGQQGVICFMSVPPLALTDDMLFTVELTGGAAMTLSEEKGPHLKLQFVNEGEVCTTTGKGRDKVETCLPGWVKVGSLLSEDMEWRDGSSPPDETPEIAQIPEPSGIALVGLSLAAAGLAGRRRTLKA